MLSNERFIRWQSVLRDHVSFVNNLFLTISVAVVGFLISMLAEKDFHPHCEEKALFTIGLVAIFISIICGFVTTITRLIDFRTTLEKVKNEINDSSKEGLQGQKETMKLYGTVTWFFLYSQIITLIVGSVCLAITFSLIYNGKLF